MSHTAVAQPQAILAFDQMAEGYDDLFTKSLIGRAQRDAVWSVASKTFRCGDHILELNCGTGEDALFFARNGVSVFACDASERMILIASQRVRTEVTNANVQFNVLATERLREIESTTIFDGAFSNFSGLNCVADLKQTANDLTNLLPPGAPVLICLSTRFCISEIIWFLLHGEFRKAFRRCSGRATAKVGEFTVDVYYPTVRQLRKSFYPSFTLQSITGIGVTVPPSYVESWIRKYPMLLSLLRFIDTAISTLPGFRVVGDHVLLRFKRGKG
jgi:ubiquinone/menaquinone biosynthesis C-methylase UbiE